MSFKKISGIVQIPIFIQLHYFSSGTALSQGSSEKFPIRSEKFSYSKKDVDKRCWFSVVCCANLVEFRIKIYVLKVIMAVVNFAMYLLFSSHSKNCFYLFLNSVIAVDFVQNFGMHQCFLNSHLKRKLYYRKRKA